MCFTQILTATLAELEKTKHAPNDRGHKRLAEYLGVSTETIRVWGKGKLPFTPRQEKYANQMQKILSGEVRI